MQHAVMQTTAVTASPFKEQMERGNESGKHSNANDKTTTNRKQMTNNHLQTSSSLPPTQMAHDLNEPKNSEKITKQTMTKGTSHSVIMPHPTESGGDAVDCALAAEQKENRHELSSTPNGSQSKIHENCGPQSTTKSAYHHKDGHYFLKLLAIEKSRLLTMADQAERDMYLLTTSSPNNEISDEVFGILRSVSGKTKLLVSQKFKQFEGLCESNLNQGSDDKFPTTTEDLLGFWDMVNLQIQHIDSLFKELDLIKANNWQTTKDSASPFVPTGSKLSRKPVLKNDNNNIITSSKISPNAALMAQKRDMQRKQLLELKRRNKNAASDKGSVSSPIEIFVRESFI